MAITDSTATGVQFASGQDFYDHILTDYYLPMIADGRNLASALYAMFPKTGENIRGRFVTFPVRTRGNIGVNANRGGQGKLPDPTFQQSDTYTWGVRHVYARIKVDGPTMDAAKTDAAAYIDVVDLEMNGIRDDFMVEQNRMMHNDGSGRLAEIATVGGSGALTLRIHSGIEGNTTCDSAPTQFIEPGNRLAFMAADGSSMVIKHVISVDSATQITVEDTPGSGADNTGVAANDWITRVSSYNAGTTIVSTGYKSEPMGIAGIFSDGDVADGNGLASGQTGQEYYGTNAASMGFQGIDSAAYSFNQAIVLDNSGTKRPLTEALMQEGFSTAEEQNNAEIDFMLSGYAMRDTYLDQLIGSKRFNNTLDLKGGHTALDFNGVPWHVDRHTPRNRIYLMGLESGGAKIYEQEPLTYLDFHGQKWDRLPDDDAYQCAMVTRYNTGVDVRDRCGAIITDLTEIR